MEGSLRQCQRATEGGLSRVGGVPEIGGAMTVKSLYWVATYLTKEAKAGPQKMVR